MWHEMLKWFMFGAAFGFGTLTFLVTVISLVSIISLSRQWRGCK